MAFPPASRHGHGHGAKTRAGRAGWTAWRAKGTRTGCAGRVTFYPFILMNVPEGNSLPNPYSDNATTLGQPALPWRGRITCFPAAGYAGTVDKTATATWQVSAFFGEATPADFAVSGELVSHTGPSEDWGLRRMILHYAHLCAAAGGVDAFLIGSELRGPTAIRDSATSYPAVAQLQNLAANVRVILGAGTKISYAADWLEYFGHQPANGSGDVFFHFDPLWADGNVDFIGIDLPLNFHPPGTGVLWVDMDLSRFDAAPLIAFTTTKETNYGHGKNG